MSDTAVSRLHDAVAGLHPAAAFAEITRADAKALDRLIAELCSEEQACEYCRARLCESCGIGEPGHLPGWDAWRHCVDCIPECDSCRRQMAEDDAAEPVRP